MNMLRQVRIAALGAGVLMFAGMGAAQAYDDVWMHGNDCVGGGAATSAYGATNNSTATSATVTCALTAAWPLGAGAQQRWFQIAYWNRSSTPGAFTCRVYGLDEIGNKVYDPGNVSIPTGAPGSGPGTFQFGVPPISAKYFSVSCTIPKSSGAGGGSSFISGIALRVAS